MARDTSPSSIPAASIDSVPGSILIIGAGVFGVSTFCHLLTLPQYAQTRITLLDTHLPSLESPTDLPTQNQNAASIDSSRIVRPDYANPSYAHLAIAAQKKWRKGYGDCLSCGQNKSVYYGIKGTGEILKCEDRTCVHEPVYREPGLVITGSGSGTEYLRKAKKNAEDLGLNVRSLDGHDEITAVLEDHVKPSRIDIEARIESREEDVHPGKNKDKHRASAVGETGYINYSCGWANSGRAMANVMAHSITLARDRNRQPGKGKVAFVSRKVAHLLFSPNPNEPSKVKGVTLTSGDDVQADLTILATGAHTPSLLDLRGRAEARGQVMAYITLTPSEARALRATPVLLNMSTGMFAIPPVLVSLPSPHPGSNSHPSMKAWLFKVAQHAYGYANPTHLTINTPGNTRKQITASIPAAQYSPIPPKAEQSLRAFLRALPLPAAVADRPFIATRLCWYTDTPTGDFLIDYHPEFTGLFLATGGSGHGFKFLPVLGEKIIKKIEGELESDLNDLWQWREGRVSVPFQGTEDGSRGGRKGQVLEGQKWEAAAAAPAPASVGDLMKKKKKKKAKL